MATFDLDSFDGLDQATISALELNTDSAWDLHVWHLGQAWAVREPSIRELLDLCNLQGKPSGMILGVFQRALAVWTGMPLAIVQSVDQGKLCEFIKLVAFRMAKRIERGSATVKRLDGEAASILMGRLLN
jgi:hypothetical protein